MIYRITDRASGVSGRLEERPAPAGAGHLAREEEMIAVTFGAGAQGASRGGR